MTRASLVPNVTYGSPVATLVHALQALKRKLKYRPEEVDEGPREALRENIYMQFIRLMFAPSEDE